MKRFLMFWSYTKDIGLMCKLFVGFFINRIGMLFHINKLKEIAKNLVCKKPYILWTDFGNYLAVSLQHYCTITDDYEIDIQREIVKIIKRNSKDNKEK